GPGLPDRPGRARALRSRRPAVRRRGDEPPPPAGGQERAGAPRAPGRHPLHPAVPASRRLTPRAGSPDRPTALVAGRIRVEYVRTGERRWSDLQIEHATPEVAGC